MPRVASLSGTSTVEPMPCRPSARIVPRFRPMWLIVLLTWVTRSLPAIGRLRDRGLAWDVQADGDATAGTELGRRLQLAQRLEGCARDVHRVRGASDLRQDVADPRGLHDGADRAA